MFSRALGVEKSEVRQPIAFCRKDLAFIAYAFTLFSCSTSSTMSVVSIHLHRTSQYRPSLGPPLLYLYLFMVCMYLFNDCTSNEITITIAIDGNSVSHTSVSTAAAGAYKSFAQSILHSSHNSEQLSSSSEGMYSRLHTYVPCMHNYLELLHNVMNFH